MRIRVKSLKLNKLLKEYCKHLTIIGCHGKHTGHSIDGDFPIT